MEISEKSIKSGRGSFCVHGQKACHPKDLREALFRSLHWGHPGRDAMLREAADIWWPGLYGEIVWLANICPECNKAGKNIKPILRKSQYGK